MSEDELRAAAERSVAAAREAAQAKLDELLERDAQTVKASEEASARFWKLAGKNHDRVLAPEAEKARYDMLASVGRVESLGLAIAQARVTLERLNDPGVIEQTLRGRMIGDTTRASRPSGLGSLVPRKERSLASNDAAQAAVKAVKDAGGDFALAAKALNDAKVTTSTGKPFTARRCKVLFLASGGEVPKPPKKEGGTAPKRATKRAAETPSNGGEDSKDVTPIGKNDQAAGTSRGGSGSRKRAGSQSQASSARKGSQRSGNGKKK